MQKEEVLNLLKEVKYLNFDEDIVSFGFVKDVEIGDQIVVNLDLPNISEENVEILYEKVHAKFKESGIDNLKLNITRKEAPKAEAKEARDLLPSVKNVIMISSGKGGVGKSTTTVNLAIALAMQGKKVGIIDADIYGPNIPRMLKFDKEKEQIMMNEDDKIIPYENYGVKMISMGHFLADGESAIWRGPVVIRAVQQLMEDVAWGELDYMVIDLPPGTGDTQLTVSQSTQVSLGIVVTTPQNVSLDDSARSLDMFTKMDIKIGGIIENMSGFLCPNCNTIHDIFGKDTTEALAGKYDTKVLGQIPIDMSVRESGDNGKPVTFFNPSSKVSESYMKVAYEVIESLEK